MAGTTARGAATRARLVETASELFAAHGVHATGLDQVLKTAGASKSQLYQHFAGKDGLVHAVIEWRRENYAGPIVRSLDEIEHRADLAAWLEEYVRSGIEVDFAQGCPLVSMASELAETDPDARRKLAGCFGDWRSALVGVAERLKSRGELPADTDTDTLARAQLALLEGGRILAQTERDERALRAAAYGALALLDAPPRG